MVTASLEGIVKKEEKEAIFNSEEVQRAISQWERDGIGKSPLKQLKYWKFVIKSTFRPGADGDAYKQIIKRPSSFVLWKSIPPSLKSIGDYLKIVEGNIHRDARSMYFQTPQAARRFIESEAQSYISAMHSTINPVVLPLSQLIISFLIGNSFSKVRVTGPDDKSGLEQTVELASGKKVVMLDMMERGGVAFESTHRNYFDILACPYVFLKHGLRNVYYVGGKNVAKVKGTALAGVIAKQLGKPLVRVFEAIFESILKSTGTIPFDREVGRKDASLRVRAAHGRGERNLVGVILQATLAYKMDARRLERANVLNFVGNPVQHGRYRDGLIPKLDSVTTKPIISNANYIFPIVITPRYVPEDMQFATRPPRNSQPFLAFIVKYFRFDHSYGDLDIHFCKPISTAEFNSKLKVEAEVTSQLIANSLLTPAGAISLAMKLYGTEKFYLQQMTGNVGRIVDLAVSHNVRTAAELTGNLEAAVSSTVMTLVKRKMLKFSDGQYKLAEPKMMDFYANMAIQPIEAHLPCAQGIEKIMEVYREKEKMELRARAYVPNTVPVPAAN